MTATRHGKLEGAVQFPSDAAQIQPQEQWRWFDFWLKGIGNGIMKEPVRPEKNQPYRIRISLWSTALVFQSKHRIALHVTSSNWPRFERHSNTSNPAPSYEQAVTANTECIECIRIRSARRRWSCRYDKGAQLEKPPRNRPSWGTATHEEEAP